MTGYRPRLTKDEQRLLSDYREVKKAAESQGIPIDDVKQGWYKSKKFSLYFKKSVNIEEFKISLLDQIKNYSPNYPKVTRSKYKESHLLVIDPADVHIGKFSSEFETGEKYNSEIAVKRFVEGVKGILNKSSGFNIDKILFIGGNDKLHIDTPKSTTTSGTPQDSDSNWYDMFNLAKDIEIKLLEILIQVADVHYIHCPSNHDYMTGFFLADVIKTWFRKSKNITFDTDMKHRKYFKYHNSLIGLTHGDGAKEKDLPLLMSLESGSSWTECQHKYIYKHHLHHAVLKDYHGVTVETLRSPSAADSWHHRNGYQHSKKAIEGFIHSKKHGQIAKLTHLF